MIDVNNYIEIICSVLQIGKPIISHDLSKLKTNTSLAVANVKDNIIYIPAGNSLDHLFAITHELRHLWQYQKHQEWIDSYKNANELSIEDYNSQFVEIDANAFTMVVFEELFDVSPTFDNLSDKIFDMICNRANEISLELLTKFNM